MALIRILDDRARAETVIAAGGRLIRHSIVMVLDLPQTGPRPDVPPGFSIAPMEAARAIEYGELVGRAYPPHHPDHEPADADAASAARTIAEYLRGSEIGPWIADASLDATTAAGRVVGMVIVNETGASDAFAAGPFVTDVCVDPAVGGLGLATALISIVAGRLTELGWAALTLVVTVGNPAQRVYERAGFRITAESWRIETEA